MGSLLCPACRGRLVRVWAPDPVGARLTMRCESCGYASHDAVVERRRAPRRPAALPVTIVHSGQRLSGRTKDVSESGMAVQVDGTPFPCGSAVRLEFTVDDRLLELVGKVVWVHALGEAEGNEMGIAIDLIRVPPRVIETLLEAEEANRVFE